MTIVSTTSVLFITQDITNYPSLLTGLTVDTQVFLIPQESDAIAYITNNLAKPTETLHLVSHGSPGCLYLRNTSLNLNNIDNYAPYLQQWQVNNILIYGCNVGVGDAGTELIEKLHQLTGAAIAAASNIIGNLNPGNNWELDVTKGEVNASIAFSQSVRETYTGVLETIVVNTLEDENDGVDTGNISLRDAINQANAIPGEDTIEFDSDLEDGTITLEEPELQIVDDLKITGLGSKSLTIDGNGGNILNIDNGSDDLIDVTISKLSIVNSLSGITSQENLTIKSSKLSAHSVFAVSNGYQTSAGVLSEAVLKISKTTISNSQNGILVNGRLDLTNSTISGGELSEGTAILASSGTVSNITDTTIKDGFSGGISTGGTLNLSDSTLSNIYGLAISGPELNISNITISDCPNVGDFPLIGGSGTLNLADSSIVENGAGISFTGESNITNTQILNNTDTAINTEGTLNLTNSTISGNSTTLTSGGAISNFGSGIINILNSTISNNYAINGGGIYARGILTLNLSNSTVSGNSAREFGGGINIIYTSPDDEPETSIIQNSTITDNEAPEGKGSGIANDSPLEIANSIVAGNVNTDLDFVGEENTFTSLGGNLIGFGSGALVFDQGGDTTAIEDPQLGELADNGGPTETHLPLEGSPVIDAGINDLVPSDLETDQRGLTRIANDTVDIGAVELPSVIRGTDDNDLLTGSDLEDIIEGLDGKDTLEGEGGNDRLDGGRQRDRLIGSKGNDILVGESGDDLLNGGKGKDQFQFNSLKEGVDTIKDFDPEQDLLTIAIKGFSEGELSEQQFLTISNFDDLDNDFNLGFVYATDKGNLGYIDQENDISLTEIAILSNQPDLQAKNIVIL